MEGCQGAEVKQVHKEADLTCQHEERRCERVKTVLGLVHLWCLQESGFVRRLVDENSSIAVGLFSISVLLMNRSSLIATGWEADETVQVVHRGSQQCPVSLERMPWMAM
eukprot:768235-Hanusia_phi.AAC.5